jgi:hypothetical protein
VTPDLWFLVGYVAVFEAISLAPELLYRKSPTLDPADSPFRRRKKWGVILYGAAWVGVPILVTLGGVIGIELAFGMSWRGYVHAVGLAAAVGLLCQLLFRSVAGVRVVHGKVKARLVAARGGWRSALEWALVLTFVGVTTTELIVHLR